MADYDNNNSGVLFVNDRKQSDRHPDYKGSAEVDGVEYWVSGWKKQSRNGGVFLSLSFQPKEAAAKAAPAPANDDDKDLPF